MFRLSAWTLALAGFGPTIANAAAPAHGALQVFEQAEAICDADGGRLWGRNLCGPMVIVDPLDRGAVANQADPDQRFRAVGRVFVGRLPDHIVLANTAVTWNDQRWTELLWPLPGDADVRRVTLAHELFHRIQGDLGLSRPEPANLHLDAADGRALLRLEWRALDAALAAADEVVRREAVADALAFRHQRYRLYPRAAGEEHALETNEGIASYTGVRLGLTDPTAQVAYARREISALAASANYVRTFAYATGPAYGLLLDAADPAWRTHAADGRRLDERLQSALKLSDAAIPSGEARASIYGGAEILAAEREREREREAYLAALKAQLVDGPRLLVPTKGTNIQFNPQNVISLEPHGLVYPTLQLSGSWGVLEVKHGGALLDRSTKTASVSLVGATPDGLSGAGWRLVVRPGWRLVDGARVGDRVLEPIEAPGQR